MSTESSSAAEDLRDRTAWLWIGIIVLVVVAGVMVWVINSSDPAVSRVRVKHILIGFESGNSESRASALETITGLRERIARGESFEKLAREYSDDTMSAARGGDLGYVKRGALSKNVESYVWDAPLNTVSDIIETPFGYHLVVVVDRELASGDRYQRELEERVLREMEAEKAGTAPASTPAGEQPAEAPAGEQPADASAPPPSTEAPAQ